MTTRNNILCLKGMKISFLIVMLLLSIGNVACAAPVISTLNITSQVSNSTQTNLYGLITGNGTHINAVNENNYAYLPGRAGGQVLTGGTQNKDNLYINSTSATTKGEIYLNPDGGNTSVGSTLRIDGGTNFAQSGFALRQSSGSGLLEVGNHLYIDLDDDASSLSSSALIVRGSGLSKFVVREDGLVGIGAASYTDDLSIVDSDYSLFFRVNTTTHTVAIGGIGTPTAQLHTLGTVRFQNFGAGTATFDAGGNLTSVSDSKAKTNIATYPAGLAQVLQLSPKQYKYSPDSGLDTQNTYIGFIAQDVEKVLPDAVKTKDDVKYEQKLSKKGATADEDEYETVEVKTGTQTKSLDDRAIIAALVNAVKEQQEQIDAQQKQIDDLTARITKLEAGRIK